ncbi:putative protein YcbL [Chlamydiales bacterium STE3]|nr:putative protein YcbL [Chlamydiales bacterium STE3]
MLVAFPSGPFETNAYILYCPQTKIAAIIDPAPGSAQNILSFIKKEHLLPEKILLTHTHFDHIADVAPLAQELRLKVGVHKLDAQNLIRPGSDGLPLIVPVEPFEPDFFFSEVDLITIGQIHLKVLHTPGHTPGGVCFYLSEHSLLISGDTLFKGTIGNLSFPTAQPDLMWQSLKKLAKLDPNTKVYPGHGPSTTIGAESWLKDAEQYFN